MVATAIDLGELVISEYQVMRSAAGFYVGRSCYDADLGPEWEEPYDRLTDYFRLKHEAQEYLDHLNYSWNEGHEQWPDEEDPQLDIPF